MKDLIPTRKCTKCKKKCAEWEFFHPLVEMCRTCEKRTRGGMTHSKNVRSKAAGKKLTDGA